MAEDLTPADVEAYTNGRLLASDDQTQVLLDTALARCRRFCNWYVSPVVEVTTTFRGSGDHYLVPKTLNIVDINSIIEIQYDQGDPAPEVTIDPSTYRVYDDEPFAIYRRDQHWHHCYDYVVTFSHGYAAIDAMDFREAVLQYIDTNSLAVGTGGIGPMTDFKVDDVEQQWGNSGDRGAGAVANNPLVASALYQYRLLPFA